MRAALGPRVTQENTEPGWIQRVIPSLHDGHNSESGWDEGQLSILVWLRMDASFRAPAPAVRSASLSHSGQYIPEIPHNPNHLKKWIYISMNNIGIP
jgi:hypothetical protein